MSTRWPAGGLIEDDVLVRSFCEADAGPLLSHLREPTVRRWAPVFQWPDQADAAHRVSQAIDAAERGEPSAFVIASASRPGHLLGTIDFRNSYPHAEFSIRDIGYAVSASSRGRGLATTGLRLLTRWLLDPAGGDVHRAQLDHAVENVASCRTALRAGFDVEGRRDLFLPLRADPDAPVVRHDVCLHGRVRR
jgi:RimJ/RimL family protein N-acetyltransferase